MIRLIIAILLFLISLLVFVKAPTNFLWKVNIATTEFPYIPFSASVIFLIACFYAEKYKLFLISLSALSTFFYVLPVIEVYVRGKDLAAELKKKFPYTEREDQLQQPFSIVKLFTGVGIIPLQPQALVYKTVNGIELTLDLYAANTKNKAPCVIVIHGGSWASGDNKEMPELNSYLAARGYNVVAINYRLAPEYKSPMQVEDTKDAIRFLIEHANELHIDTNNFVLLGRSAGAQVALMAAYTSPGTNIKGVVSFYGPADMVWGARLKSNKLVLNTDQVFRNYFGGLIDEVPQKYHEASAFEAVSKHSPPTLLVHGPNDALVSYGHSVRLSQKLEANGVASYFLNLPWATHGCDYNINGPSGQITTFAVERFINSVTSTH